MSEVHRYISSILTCLWSCFPWCWRVLDLYGVLGWSTCCLTHEVHWIGVGLVVHHVLYHVWVTIGTIQVDVITRHIIGCNSIESCWLGCFPSLLSTFRVVWIDLRHYTVLVPLHTQTCISLMLNRCLSSIWIYRVCMHLVVWWIWLKCSHLIQLVDLHRYYFSIAHVLEENLRVTDNQWIRYIKRVSVDFAVYVHLSLGARLHSTCLVHITNGFAADVGLCRLLWDWKLLELGWVIVVDARVGSHMFLGYLIYVLW